MGEGARERESERRDIYRERSNVRETRERDKSMCVETQPTYALRIEQRTIRTCTKIQVVDLLNSTAQHTQSTRTPAHPRPSNSILGVR